MKTSQAHEAALWSVKNRLSDAELNQPNRELGGDALVDVEIGM